MAIPQQLDFVKILAEAKSRISEAWDDWSEGILVSEEPIINRLMRHFRKIPAGCDIGSSVPVIPTFDHALLHRKGLHNKDQYGSDLALTVRISQLSWIKTALFQTKVSEGYEVTLEKTQLDEANRVALTRNNSFVLAIEKDTNDYRIATVPGLLGNFPPGQQTHKYTTNNWQTFDDWLRDWFDGTLGTLSNPKAPKTLEKMLKPYLASGISFDVHAWSQDDWFGDGEFEPNESDSMTPLAWMIFTLNIPGRRAPASLGEDASIKIKYVDGYPGRIM